MRIDLTGQTFGRWTVLERVENRRYAKAVFAQWLCRCACGGEKVVLGSVLRAGESKSCGCLNVERARTHSNRLTHGNARAGKATPEYRSWYAMKRRCLNVNSPKYQDYGGRGIKVCERWLEFPNFLADMGPKPSSGHSVDRIDNDGPYSPENCRWATASEQARNKRRPIST